MASGILGISITGLNAAMGAVRTTQHNIANANTPGYHRQAVQLAANAPAFTGAGFFGNGVSITTVARIYSQFLDNELMRAQGQLARHEVYAAHASQIDRLLGDQDSGLNSALSAFFSAVQEVANDPTSMAAREAMLAAGRNLAGRMNNLGVSLEAIQASINAEMATIANQANAYLRRIADLNDRIALMQAMGGEPPNDLIDQREQLTAELNQLIDVSVVRGGDGAYNLYLGGGQPLLTGKQPNLLRVVDDPYDARLKTLALGVGGASLSLDAALVDGGRLGGLLALRKELLQPTMQALGRLAVALADQFNDIHDNGHDLTGAVGGNFFTPAAALISQPMPAAGNTGSAVITATLTNSNQLTDSDYLLTYDGSNYTLTRLRDGASATGALSAVTTLGGQPQGFSLSGAGAPTAGDRWLIRLTADAARSFAVTLTDPQRIAAAAPGGAPGDNSNALALAALQTTPLLSNGTATLSGHYAQLVARTAGYASEAELSRKAYDNLARQAFEAQQSLSGVNLDEEAANLMRYQQAYQAAARAMQVANTLLDELLAIGR
ncbi:MAG: flagellar hook-associated protein FlgK [Thiobacillaceae bacterium]